MFGELDPFSLRNVLFNPFQGHSDTGYGALNLHLKFAMQRIHLEKKKKTLKDVSPHPHKNLTQYHKINVPYFIPILNDYIKRGKHHERNAYFLNVT